MSLVAGYDGFVAVERPNGNRRVGFLEMFRFLVNKNIDFCVFSQRQAPSKLPLNEIRINWKSLNNAFRGKEWIYNLYLLRFANSARPSRSLGENNENPVMKSGIDIVAGKTIAYSSTTLSFISFRLVWKTQDDQVVLSCENLVFRCPWSFHKKSI